MANPAPTLASITRASNPWTALGPSTEACAEPTTCTAGKVLGCRYYEAGFVESLYETDTRPDWDVSSCVDVRYGHGTFVSSIAAGNPGAPTVQGGRVVSQDGMSGAAPGAAVIMYKVQWNYIDKKGKTGGYGMGSDVMAAIEQAVKDGVDVINYSMGDVAPITWFDDATFRAFFGATMAGIFVAAAGGNRGGTKAVVENTMPWATTVAPGTHTRAFSLSTLVVNGSGITAKTYKGDSIHYDTVGPVKVYFAGKKDKLGSLCLNNSLSAVNAAGKFVICNVGPGYPKVDPSEEVLRVGGAGMVLVKGKAYFELAVVSLGWR